MENKKILFQVKDLEKVILRNLALEHSDCRFNKMPTPTQMQIIGYIMDNFERVIYQKELENVLNLRRATVSDCLSRMEKKGLIKREIDENDTRTKKILLSKEAKNIFNNNEQILNYLEMIAIKGISKKDLEIFSSVIEVMTNNLNENINKS